MYFSALEYISELKAAGFTDAQAQVIAKKLDFFINEIKIEIKNNIKNELRNIMRREEKED